jgi:hypothetical protein
MSDRENVPADDVPEKVARYLHQLLAPTGGEDTAGDWLAMNRWRRAMYLTEADYLIDLIRSGAVPVSDTPPERRGYDAVVGTARGVGEEAHNSSNAAGLSSPEEPR